MVNTAITLSATLTTGTLGSATVAWSLYAGSSNHQLDFEAKALCESGFVGNTQWTNPGTAQFSAASSLSTTVTFAGALDGFPSSVFLPFDL